MDIKQNKTASPTPERCAFLGLREDPQTALAFPSIWNFCHKVRPARSVTQAYQRDVCQSPACRQCPVMEAEHPRSLPVEARSHNPYGMSMGQSLGVAFLVVLVLVLATWLYWIYFPAANPLRTISGFLHFSPVAADTPTREITSSPSMSVVPTLTSTSDLPSPAPSSTDPSASQAASAAEAICGYELDETIRSGYQLILHRAVSGENLNKYASDFNTTVEAIQSANYQLPMPLRIDWVLVIPVGVRELQGMPPFEPYFESAESTLLSEAAQTLSIDEATLRNYNGFADDCQTVTGWILIPRSSAD